MTYTDPNRRKKHLEILMYDQPVVEFSIDSLTYVIKAKRGGVIYDNLSKPEADAIFEAHTLLGWDLEYEQIGPYLVRNYRHLFKS